MPGTVSSILSAQPPSILTATLEEVTVAHNGEMKKQSLREVQTLAQVCAADKWQGGIET